MSKRSRLSSVEEVKVCVLLVEVDTDNVQAVMATLLLIAFVTYPPLHNETSDRMQDLEKKLKEVTHCVKQERIFTVNKQPPSPKQIQSALAHRCTALEVKAPMPLIIIPCC